MKLETSRFGEIEVDKSLAIHFSAGLLGFPDQKDYVILQHKPGSPFCWLQSLTLPDLAFVMTDPHKILPDYLRELPEEEINQLSREINSETVIFALVTIPPGNVKKATVNLLGPLVINTESKSGKQVILSNSGYNHRHPFIHDR